MKRKKRVLFKSKKSLVLLLAVSSCFNYGFAQLSPANDPSWGSPIPLASDEFNSVNLNTGRWTVLNSLNNGLTQAVYMNPQNTIIDNQFPTDINGAKGALRFKFTANSTSPPWLTEQGTPNNPGNFNGGGIMSNSNYYAYKYGFYEIRVILPSYQDPDNPGHYTELGIMPQVMLFNLCYCGTGPGDCPNALHDEVDIIEGDGTNNQNFGIDSHWHAMNTAMSGCANQYFMSSDKHVFQPSPTTPMVNTFHKIGCELMPNKIIFYFDDVPVSTFNGYVDHWVADNNLSGVGAVPLSQNNMSIAMCLAYGINGANAVINPAANVTPIPAQSTIEFVVDYFRYYTLNSANCGTPRTINGNIGIGSFTSYVTAIPQIWSDVTIAGTVNVSGASSVLTVRQVNDFTVPIGASLEVPLSSQLTVIPTPCQ